MLAYCCLFFTVKPPSMISYYCFFFFCQNILQYQKMITVSISSTITYLCGRIKNMVKNMRSEAWYLGHHVHDLTTGYTDLVQFLCDDGYVNPKNCKCRSALFTAVNNSSRRNRIFKSFLLYLFDN